MLDTRALQRPVAVRDARLADETEELKAFYRNPMCSTGREILFLWVARMVMLGLEFAGEIPFTDVYLHSIIQGRTVLDVEVAGHGRRSAGADRGWSATAVFTQGGDFPADRADAGRFGRPAMSSTQDVRFNEEKVAQGLPAGQQAPGTCRGSVLLRLPEGLELSDAAPRPRAVEDAGTSAPAGRQGRRGARDRRVRVPHARARRLYAFVYDELLRLDPRAVKSASTPRTTTGAAEVALHVLAETLAPGDLVILFVTEEIWGDVPGSDDLLMAHAQPEPDPALSDPAAEDEVGRADRRRAGAARLARPRRRAGDRPGRLDASGFERTAP